MKQTLLVLGLIIFVYYFIGVFIENNVEIPEDSIRIRILANSNSTYDQEVKGKVKEEVQGYMYNLLKEADNSKDAEKIISNNINKIEQRIGNTLHQLNYGINYNVNFGLNYFPKKKYKGVVYKEGYYESLLITLGEGKGDNWWCVLFPPLCLIEAEESSEIEYKSFIKELIEKYV